MAAGHRPIRQRMNQFAQSDLMGGIANAEHARNTKCRYSILVPLDGATRPIQVQWTVLSAAGVVTTLQRDTGSTTDDMFQFRPLYLAGRVTRKQQTNGGTPAFDNGIGCERSRQRGQRNFLKKVGRKLFKYSADSYFELAVRG